MNQCQKKSYSNPHHKNGNTHSFDMLEGNKRLKSTAIHCPASAAFGSLLAKGADSAIWRARSSR